MDRHEAEALLRKSVGKAAGKKKVTFNPGQWEAIDALANRREKILVVQRTGWGKSSVYFISTRILRDRGAGPTIIVSPLLALMDNQIEAADRIGIRPATINSTNTNEWNRVVDRILNNQVDALLISPERLANENFREEVLYRVADRIGLFVVDEVHCISEWGHDFRPDYQRLVDVLKLIPQRAPVLGTTATVNERVIEDVRRQLGNLKILRGPLLRESLMLENLNLPNKHSRLDWLFRNIPRMPGTGIVYTITKRDADQLAFQLTQQGINARAYYSDVRHQGFSNSSEYRKHLQTLLDHNQIKALVATVALGMGYDKPDLGFVIHYQAASSLLAYYQQVGRAGRQIDTAYGILMEGREDKDIHQYFRDSAFPNERHANAVLAVLAEKGGLSAGELTEHFDRLKRGTIDKVLKTLSAESPAPVIKRGAKWYRLPVRYRMDHERIERVTRHREREWAEMQSYVRSKSCLMAYLRDALDDTGAGNCGKCAICLGRSVVGV